MRHADALSPASRAGSKRYNGTFTLKGGAFITEEAVENPDGLAPVAQGRPFIWYLYAALVLFQFLTILVGNRERGSDIIVQVLEADALVGQILESGGEPTEAQRKELSELVRGLRAEKGERRNVALRAAAALEWEYELGDARKSVALLKDGQDERDTQLNRLWRSLYGNRRFAAGEAMAAPERLEDLTAGNVADLARIRLLEVTGRAKVADKLRAKIKKDLRGRKTALGFVGSLFGIGMLGGVGCLVWYVRRCRTHPPSGMPPAWDMTVADGLGEGIVVHDLILVAVGGVAALAFSPALNRLSLGGKIWLSSAIMIVGFLLAFRYLQMLGRRCGFELRDLGWHLDDWKANLLWGVGACGVAFVVAGLAGQLGQFIFSGLPQSTNPIGDATRSAGGAGEWVAIMAIAAIVAPLNEELFFRGVLFMGLWRRLGRFWPASLLAALAFALGHPQLFSGLLPVMSVGVVSSLLLRERRSLFACMVMHGLYNAAILTIAGLVG